jgi:hypothetical protein
MGASASQGLTKKLRKLPQRPPLTDNDLSRRECPGPGQTAIAAGNLASKRASSRTHIVYRHFSLSRSSSASRFTAGASEFFILGERPAIWTVAGFALVRFPTDSCRESDASFIIIGGEPSVRRAGG